jgi:hypothetical protein
VQLIEREKVLEGKDALPSAPSFRESFIDWKRLVMLLAVAFIIAPI